MTPSDNELHNKVAIVHGAGGAIGGTVARAFGAAGAIVFLAGRHRTSIDAVASEIRGTGGRADAAQVDALDTDAVGRHAEIVIERAGRIDISFNAICLGETQGAPLLDVPLERFVAPIITATRSQFLPATTAARHMVKQREGVILAITAQAARKPYADVGGFGVAGAAIEALCRQLAVELGPYGVRVVCLRSGGSPDAPATRQAWSQVASKEGISREAFESRIAERTMLRRLPLLADVAESAVFFASDRARCFTGAIANLTCGEIAD